MRVFNNKERTILIFEVQDWEKCNRKHLYFELARYFNLVIVEPKVFFPKILKIWREWGKLFSRMRRIESNVIILKPFMFMRLMRFVLFFKLEKHLYLAQIRSALRKLHLPCDVLWLCDPFHDYLVGMFDEMISIYRVHDDYSSYPNVNPVIKEQLLAREKTLCSKVDLVYAVSRGLLFRIKQYTREAYYLPNGANIDHFLKATHAATPIAEDIDHIKRPIVGFVGKLNESMDGELVQYLSLSHPEWSFVIVGPVYIPDFERFFPDFRELKRHKNIHFLGFRPFELLPNYMKAFNVCIMPYVISQRTEMASPVKLYEYLATGKPVVSTPIAEVKPLEDIVRVAFSKEEFARCIADSLSEDDDRFVKKRLVFARQNTWRVRADEIRRHILGLLNG